jgi:hypothetical protein
MANKCEFGRKDGTICGANAQLGKDVCVFHDPAKQADGRRARRAGGLTRSKPAQVLPAESPDVQLTSSKDVAVLLSESISQTLRGELDPRVANTIGFLSGVLLKALEQGVVEERLLKVETALGLLAERHGKDGDNNR